MFPSYDKNALNTLLRANGMTTHLIFSDSYCFVDNMLNQTIEYILQLNEEQQKSLADQ